MKFVLLTTKFMKEINYKKLEDLVKSLEKGLKKIKKGKISTDEMNLLLGDARFLHERISIIQYLFLKQSDQKENIVVNPSNDKKKKQISSEKIEDDEKNQINLLDAIDEEEEKKDSVNGELPFENQNEMNLSLNDAFSNSDFSLADKLRKKPVEDLISAIGINEKFLFTNDLFNGSSEDFIEHVGILNQQNDLSKALEHINETLVLKYNWNTKSKQFKEFVNLVERRYMQ